jgi:exoribonuclease R
MEQIPVRLFIDDRNYMSWKIYNLDSKEEIQIDGTELSSLNPVEKKLFNNDIIHHNGELVYSYIRECPSLAGILLLENNKTYGRTENKKRLLYKCIPDDKRIPAFLIPYDIKLGFSKNIHDKYVVFRFDHWTNQHPRGLLIEVLGDSTNLESFYEYKLYCRNLNVSNKDFSKKTHKLFHTEKTEEYILKIRNNPKFIIEDRTEQFIFTIDPKNSLDYDDAFSINTNPDGTTTMSIYIANVFVWMETFGLWESFHKRVSTIYLPDRRRPMLPTILSDNLCSLLENQSRFTFCMDITFPVKNSETIKSCSPIIKFSNVLIKVNKNFVYEESTLLKNKHYQHVLEISKKLDSNITESHGVVAFWMVYMNKSCGNHMFNNNVGIYRSISSKNTKTSFLELPENTEMTSDTKRLIYNWSSMCGQYTVFSENAYLKHDLLNTNNYVHITSPIRRLVDLLNQIIFFQRFSLILEISKEGLDFLQSWMSEIGTINEKMKSTVKIERECEVMRKCLTRSDILTHYHEAYVIDIRDINDMDIPMFKYTLYLENEKMILELKSEQKKEIYKKYKVQLYKIESYGIASKIKIGWYEK